MNERKEAQLTIWINGQPEEQAKFQYVDGKPFLIANMTEIKWIRMYGGYGIAVQLLNACAKAKIHPTILYKREDLKQYYTTNRSAFDKYNGPFNFGGHRQLCLPLRLWKWHNGMFKDEKFGLPTMSVDKWLKGQVSTPVRRPIIEDYSINSSLGSTFKEMLDRQLKARGLSTERQFI